MHNFPELIEKLGGSAAIARAIRGPYADAGVVRQWKARGSIPPAYWPHLIRLAKDKGIAGVNEGMLGKLAIAADQRRVA